MRSPPQALDASLTLRPAPSGADPGPTSRPPLWAECAAPRRPAESVLGVISIVLKSDRSRERRFVPLRRTPQIAGARGPLGHCRTARRAVQSHPRSGESKSRSDRRGKAANTQCPTAALRGSAARARLCTNGTQQGKPRKRGRRPRTHHGAGVRLSPDDSLVPLPAAAPGQCPMTRPLAPANPLSALTSSHQSGDAHPAPRGHCCCTGATLFAPALPFAYPESTDHRRALYLAMFIYRRYACVNARQSLLVVGAAQACARVRAWKHSRGSANRWQRKRAAPHTVKAQLR